MLIWRLTLGAAFIAALALLFAADVRLTPPGVLVAVIVLGLAMAASRETLDLLAERQLYPDRWVVYGGSALLVIASCLSSWLDATAKNPLAWILVAAMATTMGCWMAEMRRYTAPGRSIVQAALALFAALSIGLPLAFLVQLRLAADGPVGRGSFALASLLIVVKLSDIGAYTVGRLIGRHKMSPMLSPGKTLEGAAGAILFGCAGAWLSRVAMAPLFVAEGPRLAGVPWSWLLYGIVIAVFGLGGDLAESLLKRDMNRKDSSHWMPGFGGVLDLIDSVLAVAPVAYLFWMCGWVGI